MAFFTLSHDLARERALKAVRHAPDGFTVKVSEPRRNLDQNAIMWAMLTDISIASPVLNGEKRRHTREVWKSILMSACGYEVQFLQGIDGNPFPAGFRTSHLTKRQMSEFIEYIKWFGDEHGVRWSNDPINSNEKVE